MGRKRTTPLETSCILKNKGNHHAVCFVSIVFSLAGVHFVLLIQWLENSTISIQFGWVGKRVLLQ